MAATGAPRLLFLVGNLHAFPCGTGRGPAAVCRALAERGFDVHVAAAAAAGAPPEGVTLHLGLDRPEELLREVRPDLTVDWGLRHPAAVHVLDEGTRAGFLPFCLPAYSGPARLLKWLGRRLSSKHRAVIRREARLLRDPQARHLAVSGLVARQAVAGGAAPERVAVLPGAVDTGRFSPERVADRRPGARRRLELAAGEILCLFPVHSPILDNLHLLWNVFHRLHVEHPRLRLAVAGPAAAPPFRAPWFLRVPPDTRPEDFYAAGDLLLRPAYFDPFGDAVLEAMACGLTVVVSDCCGVTGLLDSGNNGFVLPVRGNRAAAAGEWAGLLEWLAGDPGLLARVGAAARKTALEHEFSRFADHLAGILRPLCRPAEFTPDSDVVR